MPWSQTSPMDQRTQFIADYLREVLSVTELCDLYGIARKTAYKWIDRYPLTVTDGFSRYLLGCQGLNSTAVAEAKPVFTRLFREYGLPQRIRTDNGVPFATNTLARLSSLSAWWVRLGILPELIEPGKPQQNGRHERMHRTLKAECCSPPARDAGLQQIQQLRLAHVRGRGGRKGQDGERDDGVLHGSSCVGVSPEV